MDRLRLSNESLTGLARANASAPRSMLRGMSIGMRAWPITEPRRLPLVCEPCIVAGFEDGRPLDSEGMEPASEPGPLNWTPRRDALLWFRQPIDKVSLVCPLRRAIST